MTNKEIIEKVNQWQQYTGVPHLACQNEFLHRKLVAQERDGKVILICVDCDYTQDWIPQEVLGNYVNDVQQELKKYQLKTD